MLELCISTAFISILYVNYTTDIVHSHRHLQCCTQALLHLIVSYCGYPIEIFPGQWLYYAALPQTFMLPVKLSVMILENLFLPLLFHQLPPTNTEYPTTYTPNHYLRWVSCFIPPLPTNNMDISNMSNSSATAVSDGISLIIISHPN